MSCPGVDTVGLTRDLDLPADTVSRAALDLIVQHEPEYLINHSIRSYLFARSFAKSSNLHPDADYDDRLLFLATILHDIGLTAEGSGDQRFEVDGADRAARFARAHGLGDDAAELVWDAVALHTSPGIANRKAPEISLAFTGIAADIFEFGADQLDPHIITHAHQRLPRRGLRETLIRQVADQLVENPRKHVPSSFPAEALRMIYPDAAHPGIADIVADSRWVE
jgi:hypothetical protein